MRKKPKKPNASYILKASKRIHEKRLLSLDPGSRNMGIACLGAYGNKIEVIANSIMTHPIESLVDDYKLGLTTYLEEVARWVKLYRPDGFIMERFQTRSGSGGGPLIELVSVMVGAITTQYVDKPCRIVAAATWKNAFHRRFTEVALDELYRHSRTTPHQLDAILIGCFGLESGMQKEFDYDPLDIVEQAEATSRLPLINRRR